VIAAAEAKAQEIGQPMDIASSMTAAT